MMNLGLKVPRKFSEQVAVFCENNNISYSQPTLMEKGEQNFLFKSEEDREQARLWLYRLQKLEQTSS